MKNTKNMTWRIIDADLIDGVYSAALFESIGLHVGSGEVEETILFWRVKNPTIYLGYHQYVEDEINEEYCTHYNITIVRRILGGGCGFCDQNQILYSIIGRENGILPQDIEAAYKTTLRGLINALRELGHTAHIDPLRHAVYTQGKKISGNAQGRFNNCIMINGSFLLDFDFNTMNHALKNPTKNLKPVKSAEEGMTTLKQLTGSLPPLNQIKTLLRRGFEEALNIQTQKATLTPSEINTAEKLKEKYKSREWTYRMDEKRRRRKRRKEKS
jgi:lipoate-protein ligase A